MLVTNEFTAPMRSLVVNARSMPDGRRNFRVADKKRIVVEASLIPPVILSNWIGPSKTLESGTSMYQSKSHNSIAAKATNELTSKPDQSDGAGYVQIIFPILDIIFEVH